MTKSSAQLDAEIAEALRAKEWQARVEREDRERRARIEAPGPLPEQLYEEYQSDFAAGVFHGEKRGRAREFRKPAATVEALRASESAKRLSDDAYSVDDHRAAAEVHRRAARLHKSAGGTDAAWLHELAAGNHRQAAAARASRAYKAEDPTRTKRSFAAYQEKLSAASEHQTMAQKYARQALAAARK